MKQLNDIYDEVNKIKTDYCFKILEDYEEKTKQYKATQINIGEMTLRWAQLENTVKALKAQLEILQRSKLRLQMEEIDEIQQRTIKEMHNLNEQAIVSDTDFILLAFINKEVWK